MNTIDQWEAEAKEEKIQMPLWAAQELDRRILALIDLIRKKDEALFTVTSWFDRMQTDHWEKTSKSYEDACKNWPNILQEPLDMLPIKRALALTEELK